MILLPEANTTIKRLSNELKVDESSSLERPDGHQDVVNGPRPFLKSTFAAQGTLFMLNPEANLRTGKVSSLNLKSRLRRPFMGFHLL